MTNLLTPASGPEAADLVRGYFEAARKLRLIGGGTRNSHPLANVDHLSSVEISGIVSYDPAELVMTARAGTPVAEVEAALSEHGQFLAFEPMDHRPLLGTTSEPTIGGVFAANASGPRRFVAGAARDHFLGAVFVNGKGQSVKAGGRVVKNVTGLDLVKLVAGSRGTLAFLTEVTFRVLPRPKASRTVMISGTDDEGASAVMAKAMSLPFDVSAAAHIPAGIKAEAEISVHPVGATFLRIEGSPTSVSQRAQKLASVFATVGNVSYVDAPIEPRLWTGIRDVVPFAGTPFQTVWRVSVAPTAGHRLVRALRREDDVEAYYDWQGGLVWLQFLSGTGAESLRMCIADVGGGHATLVRAPAETWAAVNAQRPSSEPISILETRIKEKFDPAGIFSGGSDLER